MTKRDAKRGVCKNERESETIYKVKMKKKKNGGIVWTKYMNGDGKRGPKRKQQQLKESCRLEASVVTTFIF